jgi:hypothetical protein
MSSAEQPDISAASIGVEYNHYLADGAEAVDAIVTVAITRAVSATGLTLRVWTPVGAHVPFLGQVAPTVDDLTHRRIDAGNQTGEYPLGDWSADEKDGRDYHIKVEVAAAAVGRTKLAARVSVVADDQVVGEAAVPVEWTADRALSAEINSAVAHYTGQEELAELIAAGVAAHRGGDLANATARFRRARDIAEKSGPEETARLLRREVSAADVAALDAVSTRTARVRRRED